MCGLQTVHLRLLAFADQLADKCRRVGWQLSASWLAIVSNRGDEDSRGLWPRNGSGWWLRCCLRVVGEVNQRSRRGARAASFASCRKWTGQACDACWPTTSRMRGSLQRNAYRLPSDSIWAVLQSVAQPPTGDITSQTQWSAKYNLSARTLQLAILREFGKKYDFRISR